MFKEIAKSVLTGVATALLLSLIALWSNDYLFETPQLNGPWEFTIKYENTEHQKYKNMRVLYQVALIQDAESFSGKGEKRAEQLSASDQPYVHKGKAQVPIEVTGYIKKKFFTADKIYLTINEQGTKRDSISYHSVQKLEDGQLSGVFTSTIGATSGSVVWKKGWSKF